MHGSKAMIFLIFVLGASVNTATAQYPYMSEGSKIQRTQRDHIKTHFGAAHPLTIELDAQIHRDTLARTNLNITNYDEETFRLRNSRLLLQMAVMEKEIIRLRKRVAELEALNNP